MSDFNDFEKILLEKNYSALSTTSFSDPIIKRIQQLNFDERLSTTMFDFAVLLRQLLLVRRSRGLGSKIRLDKEAVQWGGVSFWKKSLLEVAPSAQQNQIIVQPKNWNPDWLNCYENNDVDEFNDVNKEQKQRKNVNTIIDPCVGEKTTYTQYTSPGQAEAVRSMMFMPEGSTLIVNLPTGSGKTLVIQTQLLLDGPESGLTLVIVPTTALAMDQERQLKKLIGDRWRELSSSNLSYHAGLADVEKNKIRSNIRNGKQGILFTSPEAAIGNLAPAIWHASKVGNLKCLAIDEAHLVAGWGEHFRPEFQLLSGFRAGLLQVASRPFKTLLLSATLTGHSIKTLQQHFSVPGPMQMSAAVHLRPEPRYLSVETSSTEKKDARLINLLKFSPRPLIFYLNEPSQVKHWAQRLKKMGAQRFAAFHGNTSTKERLKIIDDWDNNKIDLIIATNAFGVGMDKQDVRTVIHGMVPDSLDQFYQEVGRSGRDGKSCVSVTVFDQTDVEAGRNQSRPIILGAENSYNRWRSLFQDSTAVNSLHNIRCLSIQNRQNHLRQDSKGNENWHLKMIAQMVRSGLLSLNAICPDPPEKNIEEPDAAFEKRLKTFWEKESKKIYFQIIDGAHMDRNNFEKKMDLEKSHGQRERDHSFDSLMQVLRGETEMGDALSRLYRISPRDYDYGLVAISKICRGCPYETRHDISIGYEVPPGSSIKTAKINLSLWEEKFGYLGKKPYLLYPAGDNENEEKIKKLLELLTQNFNFKDVVISPTITDTPWIKNLYKGTSGQRLVQRTFLESSPDHYLPRVTLLWKYNAISVLNQQTYGNDYTNVYVIPDDLPGLVPGRRIGDTERNSITYDQFMRQLK